MLADLRAAGAEVLVIDPASVPPGFRLPPGTVAGVWQSDDLPPAWSLAPGAGGFPGPEVRGATARLPRSRVGSDTSSVTTATAVGFVSAGTPEVVRDVALVVEANGARVVHLGLAAAMQMRGGASAVVHQRRLVIDPDDTAPQVIHLNGLWRATPRWPAASWPPHVSLSGGPPAPAAADGLTVFVAPADTGSSMTPGGGPRDRASLTAAIANAVLTDSFITVVPWWLLLGVGAVVAGVLAWLIRPAGLAAALIVLTCAVLAAAGVGLGFVWDLFAPGSSLAAAGVLAAGGLGLQGVAAARGRQVTVRREFLPYVGDQQLQELARNPPNLAGALRTVTCLHTDVDGLEGPIGELEPPALLGLLSEYLEELSRAVLARGGTVELFAQAGMRAVFGAPAALEAHPAQACATAMALLEVQSALNTSLMARKLITQPLSTLMGLATASAVVGNAGTSRRVSYTALGSAPLLAGQVSRLNRFYHTRVLITEATREAAGDRFVTRMLDRVRAGGKGEPLRLLQLLGDADSVSEVVAEAAAHFDEGMGRFETRDWRGANRSFTRAARIQPKDATIRIYVKRCLAFEKNAPAADWDGVFALRRD